MGLLALSGQDIRMVEIAWMEDGRVQETRSVATPPEGYLAALEETLGQWKRDPRTIETVAVVRGPGSFTSCRVATVIANAFAFARSVPLVPLENPDRLPLNDLLSFVPPSPSHPSSPSNPFVAPLYDRPPHITLG